jgi:hypothetical protein
MDKRHLYPGFDKMESKTDVKAKTKQVFFSSSSYIKDEPVENEDYTNGKIRKDNNWKVLPTQWQMPSDYFF